MKNNNPFKKVKPSKGTSSYDESFNDKPKNPFKKTNSYSKESTPSGVIGWNTGIGDSSYDEGFLADRVNEGSSLNEFINERRAQKQSNIAKIASGTGRVIAKAGSEIAKMPGVLGGIGIGAVGQLGDLLTGEDNTDFMKTAFNNSWIKSVNEANEFINEEALPVYVKKSVQEGNLWDNLSSIDFWATEGADGLGFIASMFAPGAAISKIGLGEKLLGATSKYAKMSSKVDKALETMGKGGLTSKNIDLGAQTFANTLFEAGAEAQSAMDGLETKLKQRLNDGKITEGEYQELMKEQGTVGANIFAANFAVLLGPNAIMSKMIWGGPRNKAVKELIDPETGKLVSKSAPSNWKRLKYLGSDIAKSAPREGFLEEGLQSTAEGYFVENAVEGDSKNFGEFLVDLPSSYMDMLGTTEGQKAIALGAIFSGGMQAVLSPGQRKKEREKYNKLIEYANNSLDDFHNVFQGDTYKRNEDTGEIIYDENNKPQLDNAKFLSKIQSLGSLDALSAMYDEAIVSGNKDQAEQIRRISSANMILPFVMDESLGLDVLRKHLENSSSVENMSNVEKRDKDSVIKDIMTQAEQLKSDYENFENYAGSIFDFKHKNETKSDRISFLNKLNNEYLFNKNNQHFYENKIEELNNLLNPVIKERGYTREFFESDSKKAQTLRNADSRIRMYDDKINEYKEKLEEVEKINDDFWKNDKVQEAYDAHINNKEESEKAFEKEKEVESVLEKINNAKTEEELDNVDLKTDSLADSEIKKRYDNKKAELKKIKDQQKEEAVNNQSQESEENVQNDDVAERRKNDLKDKLEGFNLGESFGLTKSELAPYSSKIAELEDEDYVVAIQEDNKDDYKLFVFETLEEITIPKNIVEETSDTSTNTDDTTEGSIDHDGFIPTNNENDNDADSNINQSGSKILSTNKETGEKLSFVSQEYLDYEKEPIDKTGKEVRFEINNGNKSNKSQLENIREEKENNIINQWFQDPLRKKGRRSDGVSTNELDGKKPIIRWVNTSLGDIQVQLETSEERMLWVEYRKALKEGDNKKKSELKNKIGELVVKRRNIEKTNTNQPQTNEKEGFNNKNWNNALKGYQDLLDGKKLNQKQIDFLIDNLPINVIMTDGSKAPIETLPNTEESQKVFGKSSKILRINIVNALLQGNNIKDISTTIEGQYPGELRVEENKDGRAIENNVFNLYHFKDMSDAQKTKYIKENIGVVNSQGNLTMLNDNTYPLNLKKGSKRNNIPKGEVYLLIPMSNGKKFPLKLNIKTIEESHADILTELYKIRISDNQIKKNTTIAEIENEDLRQSIKEQFQKEKELIGKPWSDITVKDITDFMIWDGTDSIKTRVKFGGTGVKGDSAFMYGNPKIDGAVVRNIEEFNDTQFKEWLMNNKRYSINLKPKTNETSNATMQTSNSYINYLINNKILNTNAVVGENTPTFQGYSNIYLDSNNVKINKPTPQKVETLENIISEEELSKEDRNNMNKEIREVTQSKLNDLVKNGTSYIEAAQQVQSTNYPEVQEIKNRYLGIKEDNDQVSYQNVKIGDTLEKISTNNKGFKKEIISEHVIKDIKPGLVTFEDGSITPTLSDYQFKDKKEIAVLKKSPKKIRNSQNNFVSSHEVPNTEENKEITKMKEDIKEKDNIKASKEEVKALFKELKGKKLIKVGSKQYKDIMKGSNQERFNKLSEIANNNNLNVKDIITKC